MNYVALLRGINVGGNTLIKMPELRSCLEASGFTNVSTYIQSGNVLFSSEESDTLVLAKTIEKLIADTFGHTVPTVVIGQAELTKILTNTPKDWEQNPEWKYNLIFLLPPYDMVEVMRDIGELKPDIESITPGDGVLYQGMSIRFFGRTTTGKLAGTPLYKRMTIRNNRTGAKLLELLQKM